MPVSYTHLLENEETSRELKELDTKNTRAAEELEENQKAYEQTKVEYDRLEEELEQLNSQMDQLREETQNKAIRRQQLDGCLLYTSSYPLGDSWRAF